MTTSIQAVQNQTALFSSLNSNSYTGNDFANLLSALNAQAQDINPVSMPTPEVTTQQITAASGKADFVSGRIGIDLHNGVPSTFSYFDDQGELLTKSNFNAPDLLKFADKFGISKQDLAGLRDQLDAAKIGYKPYELYKGTGSDHGINFDDLMAGGLGTAYDWRVDKNAALKDEFVKGTGVANFAANQVAQAKALADRLGVNKNADVTTEKGIDASKITALAGKDGAALNYVLNTGETASWYATKEALQEAQSRITGGHVISFANGLSSTESAAMPTAPVTPQLPVTEDVAEEMAEAVAPDIFTPWQPSSTQAQATQVGAEVDSLLNALNEAQAQLDDLTQQENVSIASYTNAYQRVQTLMTQVDEALAAM